MADNFYEVQTTKCTKKQYQTDTIYKKYLTKAKNHIPDESLERQKRPTVSLI